MIKFSEKTARFLGHVGVPFAFAFIVGLTFDHNIGKDRHWLIAIDAIWLLVNYHYYLKPYFLERFPQKMRMHKTFTKDEWILDDLREMGHTGRYGLNGIWWDVLRIESSPSGMYIQVIFSRNKTWKESLNHYWEEFTGKYEKGTDYV